MQLVLEHTWLDSCTVYKTIDNEDYVMGVPINNTIGIFYLADNKETKYLPRLIAKTFPNLTTVYNTYLGLTVVRDYFFKGMGNLLLLDMRYNEIALIEEGAFKDLVSLNSLMLDHNMIETLDGQLFNTMVNLKTLTLDSNKIKFLNPTTFQIPGANLTFANLGSNVCINESYSSDKLGQLELDIKANCTH